MDSNVISAVISGVCSITSAFGAIYLKVYLDNRKTRTNGNSAIAEPNGEIVTPANTRPAEPQTTVKSSQPDFRRPVSIVIGSFVFGVITRSLRPLFSGPTHWESLIALIVLIGLTLMLALFHRRKGFQLGFQLENFAFWAGWVSGWCIVHGHVWSDVLGVTLIWWLVCAVVGGLVVSVRKGKNS